MPTESRTIVTWVLAAAVAIGLAVAGVSLATARVTPPPSTIELAADDDASPTPTDGATATPDTAGTGAATDPGGSGTPGDAPPEGDDATDDGGVVARPTDTPTPRASPSDDGADDPEEQPSDGPSDDDTEEPDDGSSTGTGPRDETRSAQAVGGTASFRFTDTGIEVLSVSPAQGFTSQVERDGAFDVEVTFTSEDHESRIDAELEGGEPRVRVREESD